VIIALGFVVLLAFVGLTVDVGQLYIHMGSLRKAVDAGALAAAAQFREGRDAGQLAASAEEIMHLNGIDPTTVEVETCESSPHDDELCVTPRRKLVRVTGEMEAPTSFLTVIGIHSFHIASSAISEAASMDVVLVIDISESMANDSSLCDGDDDDGDGVADDGRSATACAGLPAVPAAGPGSRWDNYYGDPSKCNPSDRGGQNSGDQLRQPGAGPARERRIRPPGDRHFLQRLGAGLRSKRHPPGPAWLDEQPPQRGERRAQP
jgi:hypothetical protein